MYEGSFDTPEIRRRIRRLESSRANVVPTAVENNFASFDASGDIQDSGYDAADFYTRTVLDGGQLDTRYYTESEIDTALGAYLRKDGSVALTGDWDIGDGRYIATDKVRARDAAGLLLQDDGGNGIFVEDGGQVGVGTVTPYYDLEINGAVLATGAGGFVGWVDRAEAANSSKRWGWYATSGVCHLYDNDAVANRISVTSAGNVGIATPGAQRPLHVVDVMRLEPRGTAPGSPSAGDMYIDSSNSHKLTVYDGSTWQTAW